MYDYDVAIIGAGPGGYVAGLRSAQKGFKTAVIEKKYLGGTCLNSGCIPTKALLESARQINLLQRSKECGIKIKNFSIDVNKIWERKERIVENLRKGVEYLFKVRGISFIKGEAKLLDRNTIEIKETSQKIKAKNIVIATGSSPLELTDLKFDHKEILSSDDILEKPPSFSSLIIVGGGVIGCEFASLFSSLGIKVIIVELLKNILPQQDTEISKALEVSFKKRGIEIFTETKIETLESRQNRLLATLSDGTKFEAERVLVCIGRAPNSTKIGLENLGVDLQKGWIVVDDYLRTSIPNIFAIGDIIGKIFLAHVAMFQGERVIENIEGKNKKIDYSVIPDCIYTFPEVATVGIKEEQVKEMGIDYSVGKFPFRALGKAHIIEEVDGFLKLIIDRKEETILGAQAIGPRVSEIISELTLAIKNRIKIKDILETIHAHPTFSEIIPEVIFSSLKLPLHLA